MNSSVESLIRFVNLTTAGLLAGSLGFGESALTPGWENERERQPESKATETDRYFNAIGPIALATSMTLVVGASNHGAPRRILDVLSALGLAGVVATTLWGTVPINQELSTQPPADYPSQSSRSLARNWNRVHAVRTALGISAFLFAAGSTASRALAARR